MEEGTLVRWLKSDGDTVNIGDDLAEIESDKATTIHHADAAGVLMRAIHEGDTVAIGTVIAWLGDEDAPSTAGGDEDRREVSSGVIVTPSAGEAMGTMPSARRGRFRPRASPVARRMATTHGVDLDTVKGTGPDGRIVRTDVALRIVSPAPVLSTPAGIRGVVTTQSLSRVQALIAQRMTQSRSQVPDFEVRVRVDAQPIASLRQQLKADAAELVPSVTDFIVKCAAIALREQPQANGSYRGNAWELYDRVNVGIAVATDGGLIVPTIFDADQMSLGEIRRTTQDLSARARQGRIAPGELEGATFTVSNLGMFGVDSFTAVIPPHQAAILAVGAAVRAPVVRQERVVPGLVLDLALSCDHRILYGADAARLVSRIRELLEHPLSLLVE
jgi:pyruvate dehydrogenase E2 component (dihydrolipoamide acetyltransferase)